MCQGDFLYKNPTAALEFLEDLAEKTMSEKPLVMTA